ncbi:LADA_0E12310g1_1 [Lachancea dasiensis]|uniref:LADA_0E12310g1_1 n=1 Tax=Lachancea dasiensis TaxID=1072105 RepID=A0A1G4JF22_9SACH|nr:LADA_0E12310g1_1 [Lachancea dasiensis]
MDLPANVSLLLLQLTLYRQQELSHTGKDLKLDDLLVEPVVDESILTKFSTHRLVKLYVPELRGLQLRTLRVLVNDLFKKGLPDKSLPVTVVTLANHYYFVRVTELEQEEIPNLKGELAKVLAPLKSTTI